MNKAKKIRVTESNSECFTKGKEYDVIRWERFYPVCKDDYGDVVTMNNSKWKPVPDFKHGDPVWAWDRRREEAVKSEYIGKSRFEDGCPHWVDVIDGEYSNQYKYVEHRKPTITIEELAKRADIDLNEYEIIE